MTAESVLKNVLLEIGLDTVSPQLSSGEYNMRQIKAFMNAAGRDIATRAEWSRLMKTVTVPGNISLFDLPNDFHKLPETGAVRLNKTRFKPVRVVVAPEQWSMLNARPSATTFCHLSGGNIKFAPALDGDGAIVNFVSKEWVEGGMEIIQNGDNLLIPEGLLEKGTIWRWKRQKGLPYDDILAEYEADLIAQIKADRGVV